MLVEQLTECRCPGCDSQAMKPHTRYTVPADAERTIYYCAACEIYFSQTYGTPLAGLRTPLSRIQLILTALDDGQGVNAVCRTFHVSKNTLQHWAARLAGLKETLLRYARSHCFLHQLVEGDEVYTKVQANVPAAESKGWTLVLMERASRFLWELQCGPKNRTLFETAMQRLAQVIEKTDDLSLVTDGERRYGNLLFEICRAVLHTGQPGRPQITLPEGVRVRVKNKGSQAHRRGPKRPKYQAPQPEHPATPATLANTDIHANHVEAFNAALRRRLACFRCDTNTYAKTTPSLQIRLDLHWRLHNFCRPHFTTKIVPAVALKILEVGLSFAQLFQIRPLNMADHPI